MGSNYEGGLAAIFSRAPVEGTAEADRCPETEMSRLMRLIVLMAWFMERGVDSLADESSGEVGPGNVYRPGLVGLMNAVGRGEFEVVVLCGIDRLARESELLLSLLQVIENAGLTLTAVQSFGRAK